MFVQRDEDDRIIGVFELFQEGYAEEELADDHPDVIAFQNPPLTVDDYSAAIEAHVDEVARERRYSGAVSLASYVNSTVPQWSAEAITFVAWRDTVWLYAYAELEKVQNGQRPQPTIEDFIAELAPIEWPEG